MTPAGAPFTGSYDYGEVVRSVCIAIVALYAALDFAVRATVAKSGISGLCFHSQIVLVLTNCNSRNPWYTKWYTGYKARFQLPRREGWSPLTFSLLTTQT